MSPLIRSRWAAVGAAVAVSLGAGGVGLVAATSPDEATAFVPIEPCRLADTRPEPDNVGPRDTPLREDDTFTLDAHGSNGQCVGIPASATGLALNVTAVGATTTTFLTIWGAGERPHASHLNPAPGQPPTPNAVDTGLTPSGELNIYNRFGAVDVVVDVLGYYVDHHHDDRYYTKAQTVAHVAMASDVVHHSEQSSPPVQYEPTGFNNTMTFETATAGSALITFEAGGWRTCVSQALHYYIVVDDEPVVGSARYRVDTSPEPREYRGVVDELPAGEHSISLGMECAFGGSVGGGVQGSFRQVSVVVVP